MRITRCMGREIERKRCTVPTAPGGKGGDFGMEEKNFKTMNGAGVLNIVMGVIGIVAGVTGGVLLIISGAKLLSRKSKMLF